MIAGVERFLNTPDEEFYNNGLRHVEHRWKNWQLERQALLKVDRATPHSKQAVPETQPDPRAPGPVDDIMELGEAGSSETTTKRKGKRTMRDNAAGQRHNIILPTSGSSAADGGRIADSPSPNSNDEEDIAMNHDSNEGEYSELSSEHDSTWIDVVTKARRRRQRKLNDEVGPTAEPKPPTPLPVRKAAPRPNPLPRDDFKLVLRPQDGLKLANLDIAEVSLALLNSINFTWRQANLRVRLDATQNTATISTPSSDAAKALGNLKQLKIGNTIHMVTLYGLAPDDSSKGLVRGVPLRFSDAKILANSDQS
ncbi:hypothetical protein HPB47_022215 [Ixodes persulcatus]|uniref:Uncharacterized protein n=1 Tax=Ixodes persulcatus TaxID=34615 RepID=A0AC60QB22_IXOPE|nr:hypothetical protein HPB47_022215 [Ixodes persulcatus]